MGNNGSANAAEHDLVQSEALKKKYYAEQDRLGAAQAAGRAVQATQRATAAHEVAQRAQEHADGQRQRDQMRADAALRAIPKGVIDYQSKNQTFADATDYLANKYGLNRQAFTDPEAGPLFRQRYGLRADGGYVKDAKGNNLLDGNGKPIPAHGYKGANYGADGVYIGYYETKGRVEKGDDVTQMSTNALEHQLEQHQSNPLVIPADAAKGMIFGWSPQKVAEFQKSRGIKPTGFADTNTAKVWSEGVNGAQKYYQFGGERVTPEEYLDAKYGTKKSSSGSGGSGGRRGRGGGGGGGGGGAGATSTRVTLTDRTSLQRALNQMFQDKLGRKATDAEVTKYLGQVNSQERAHPQVATVSGSGNTTVSGGIDPMQTAENYMNNIQGGDVGTRMAGVDYFASAMKIIGGGNV